MLYPAPLSLPGASLPCQGSARAVMVEADELLAQMQQGNAMHDEPAVRLNSDSLDAAFDSEMKEITTLLESSPNSSPQSQSPAQPVFPSRDGKAYPGSPSAEDL